MAPPPPIDPLGIGICPGEGQFVRNPGWLGGIPTDKALGYKGIPEYQLAQAAMFAYFYVDFKIRYPIGSFVLADAEWAYLLTGITKGDKMLDVLRDDFRRWHKKGGLLKPDILGFCAMPSQSGLMVLEMAEVTTAREAVSTLREDLNYKLGSMRDIIEGQRSSILDSFSLSNYAVQAVATKWKPAPMQRIIPLPLKTEASTIIVEWICFQPTFNRNPPHGIDGLLLYEIHSMRFKRDFVPEAVLRKFTDEERKRRASARLANGLTLTPWLTQQTLNQAPLDRDTMIAFAIVAGVGLAVLAGILLFPVVSGFELALLGELLLGTGEAEVGAAALSQASTATTAAVEIGSQWSAATGFPILAGGSMAPVLLR